MSNTEALHNRYWKPDALDKASPEAGVSLDPDHAANPLEFYLYGCRLADYLARRFEDFAQRPLIFSNVLEIGCGMARIMLPMSPRFAAVHGLDVSEAMLRAGHHYGRGLPNLHFHLGNGYDLSGFADQSFDHVYTTGVLQHINEFDVIAAYLKEGLRVLKTGGVFIFTFQSWQTQDTGVARVGARITAGRLDDALAGQPYQLLELSQDPLDPIPHMVAVVAKTQTAAGDDTFRSCTVVDRPWRTAIVADLATKQTFYNDIGKKSRRITFFDN